MPSRHGTGKGLPQAGAEGRADGSQLCLALTPVPFTRRWFSIQNSQLVYQKKLKVSCSGLTRGWSLTNLHCGVGWPVGLAQG